jgi:hypothetical protein
MREAGGDKVWNPHEDTVTRNQVPQDWRSRILCAGMVGMSVTSEETVNSRDEDGLRGSQRDDTKNKTQALSS